nr:hypothetical protein GCM10020092_094440 [Actinoplanes digitatis]
MSTPLDGLPVVVIGAGPVGLAAAAHLAERGIAYTVLEAGETAAAAVRQWGHIRVFSPWRYNIDAAARRLLAAGGWVEPDADVLPTGAQLAADYLQPLADLPALKPHVRYGARVVAVTRLGLDRVRTADRDTTPFLIRLATGEDVLARAVIDAAGTWDTPNVLGASGIPAHGETGATAFLEHALPDVLGADRDRFAGKRVLVVGAGYSAANTLLLLADLADQAPGTRVTWAIRAAGPARTYGGGAADALPARGALGTVLREHVEAEPHRTDHRLLCRRAHTAARRNRGLRRHSQRGGRPDRVRDRVPPRPRHRRRTAPRPRPDHGRLAVPSHR